MKKFLMNWGFVPYLILIVSIFYLSGGFNLEHSVKEFLIQLFFVIGFSTLLFIPFVVVILFSTIFFDKKKRKEFLKAPFKLESYISELEMRDLNPISKGWSYLLQGMLMMLLEVFAGVGIALILVLYGLLFLLLLPVFILISSRIIIDLKVSNIQNFTDIDVSSNFFLVFGIGVAAVIIISVIALNLFAKVRVASALFILIGLYLLGSLLYKMHFSYLMQDFEIYFKLMGSVIFFCLALVMHEVGWIKEKLSKISHQKLSDEQNE